MVDYWIVRRGLKRGEVPNRVELLYKAYKRWAERELGAETKPAGVQKFTCMMWSAGYKKARLRGKDGQYRWYWMLNKAVVPVSGSRL